MTPESFRQMFREFAEPDITTDDAINLYTGLATNFLDPNRWGATLDYGIALYVAHHIALDQRAVATAQAGGIPGDVRGPSTSKTTDKVAQSYDTKAVTFEDEPVWNMTTYGVRFITLARQFGAGGF